jgi:tetratricopeptide (TPR) repeat protein
MKSFDPRSRCSVVVHALAYIWLVVCFFSVSTTDALSQPVGTQIVADNVRASYSTARILNEHGHYEKAIRLLDFIVRRQPDLIGAYIERGAAYYKLHRYSNAISNFDTAIKLSPAGSPILRSAKFGRNQADLEVRLQDWRRRPHTICQQSGQRFPSKMYRSDPSHAPDSWDCDDGDMNLFNGLLCGVGVDGGCKAVQADQSVDGSWWRSPIKVDHPDPRTDLTKVQTTFNSDQALGTYLYVLQKGDSSAFSRWLTWISQNPICNTISGKCGWPSQPRFCSNFGDCGFHPIDCGMILLIGELYGQQTRALQLCAGAVLMGLVTPVQMKTWLRDALKPLNDLDTECRDAKLNLESTARKFGLPIPPSPNCPDLSSIAGQMEKRFDDGLQRVTDLQAEAERLLHLPMPGLAIAYENALSLAAINAKVNKKSEARHLAGVALLILRKLNPTDPRLPLAALPLVQRSPSNPFHIYLVEGSLKPEMLQAILDKCPDTNQDVANNSNREQWGWEREDFENTTTQSMYWDCIFSADLWKSELPLAFPKPTDPAGLAAYRSAQDAERLLHSLVDDLTAQIGSQYRSVIGQLSQLQAAIDVPNKLLEDARGKWQQVDQERLDFCKRNKINDCPPLPFPPLPGFP